MATQFPLTLKQALKSLILHLSILCHHSALLTLAVCWVVPQGQTHSQLAQLRAVLWSLADTQLLTSAMNNV